MDQPRLVDTSRPLSLDRLSPLVVHSYVFAPNPSLPAGRRLGMRQVSDYEFEFITRGNGHQYIDGVRYSMEPGLLVYRRPGQMTEGVLPYECYAIIVDMEGIRRPHRDPYWSGQVGRPPQPDFQIPILRNIPPVLAIRNRDAVEHLFRQVLAQLVDPSPVSRVLQKSMVLQLLALATQERSALGLPTENGAPPELSRFLVWIAERLHRETPLQTIAEFLGYSPAYSHKLLSRFLGMSPLAYILSLRIRKAKELLIVSNYTMEDIARQTGFENQSYFYRVFKKETGQTPGSFRKTYRLPEFFLSQGL